MVCPSQKDFTVVLKELSIPDVVKIDAFYDFISTRHILIELFYLKKYIIHIIENFMKSFIEYL